MLFNQVIGQAAVKEKLIRAIQEERIPHAMLFLGPEGCGKLGLAIAFATYISCTGEKAEDACGTCPSCTKYGKLIHPDLHFVFPVIKPKTDAKAISDLYIQQWREAILTNSYLNLNNWLDFIGAENKQGSIFVDESSEIIRKLSLKTYESDYKVMIIWMPEKMNPQAANKLLKILEEPPPNTVFILVAENTEQLLPTILSRVQLVKIPKIDHRDMLEALKTRLGMEEKPAMDIVKVADGNYLKAMECSQESNPNEQFDRFVEIMRLAYKFSPSGILDWVEELAKDGREKQKEFLLYGLHMIRENFILNLGIEQLNRGSDAEMEFSVKFSKFIHPGNASEIAEAFSKAHYHIESNAYDRLVFLDLALVLANLIKM